MKLRTSLTAVAVSLLVALPIGSAQAVAPRGPVVAKDFSSPVETVVVDGRTFGASDGLVVMSGEVDLSRVPTSTIGTDGLFSDSTIFKFGASYAKSTERVQLFYTGEAYAAGNTFGIRGVTKRVISVCFWYTRGAETVVSKRCSNATSTTGSWKAGNVVSATVRDSLSLSAPKTRFHYETTMIDPRIH